MGFPLEFPEGFASSDTLDYEDLEAALRQWVIDGTGVTNVYFADQKMPQLSGDFAVIRIGDMLPLGAYDSQEAYTDLTADAGEEVELRVRADRELFVNVQVFTESTVGNESARALLGRLSVATGLDSVRVKLQDAGLSPFDLGKVQNIAALIGASQTGRANLDCRFYLRDTVSDYVGYIDTVETESFLGPPDSGTREDIDF
jgi:hypothetical protein